MSRQRLRSTVIADMISIGKSDDELGRMLEVLRYWFTKDLVWALLLCWNVPADRAVEIRQGEAMQAIQLCIG